MYLLYLAYGAFTKAVRLPSLQTVESNHRSTSEQFLVGYLLQVTNPNAISFWIAIAVIGAVDGAAPSTVTILVVGAFLRSFGCHGAWAFALSLDSVWRSYTASRRWVEATLGCLFTSFAYRLGSAETS